MMPNFGKVLAHRVKFFEIGYHKADTPNETNLKYDCTLIFRAGGIIYITDEVFIHQPKEALKLVQLFIQYVERIKESHGILVWRLATRPGLLKFLLDLCSPYVEAIEAHHEEHRW
jgi:chromo domain-containing protein 1